ncbi:MAG TPA: BON domain-containing protein [Usitatibacter sp.]|jgi:hyperosmotically inducible periplasmic protein|nr:BON domain-containing protein [Usitatibacter sp.]
MKRLLPLAAALAAATIAVTGCDRPRTNTSMNNSGTDATPAQPAGSIAMSSSQTPPAANANPSDTTTTTTTTTSANTTPDTASANVASPAPPADNTGNTNATGAVNETVTTGKIKAAIAADSAMKDSDISVSTNNGVVTLTGTVKSQDQVSIATNLAQRQEGVQRVESNISVR